jgi:hypothetical protein
LPFDEAFSFERQHHLMDRRRADAKILLHVGFGRPGGGAGAYRGGQTPGTGPAWA